MRIGVIGAGAWGTALAQVAAANGDPVLIWAFEEEVARAINETHCNLVFLPGNDLNPAIQATTSLDDLSVCDAVLVVTPAQHLGAILGTRRWAICHSYSAPKESRPVRRD